MSNRKIILFIFLLVAVSLTAYVVIVVVPSRLAEKTYAGAKQIGEDIKKAFQLTPEVTVNNTIVLQQQTPILELATVSQNFQHQYEWTNTWLGSTKTIAMQGNFNAKAGFDLQQKFIVRINDDNAIVTLPAPQILSVELLGDVKLHDEHGVLNWINENDRAKAVNAFQQDARRYATQAEFIQQAKMNMEQKLNEIFKLHGKKVTIHFTESSLHQIYDR